MDERPAMAEGGELHYGVRFNSETPLMAERHRLQAWGILDDMQAEYAEDLPVGLMFDARNEDIVEGGRWYGVQRVLKVVCVPA